LIAKSLQDSVCRLSDVREILRNEPERVVFPGQAYSRIFAAVAAAADAVAEPIRLQ